MITVNSLETIPSLPPPIALTIGTFDGVHLGHQYLFKELKKRGTAVVLTFSNHPSEVLHGTSIAPICTLEEKLRLFAACGIDLTIVLTFTPELARTPYDAFLKQIHRHLPFTSLVLGQGAVMGHKAEGKEKQIRALAQTMNFEPIYLPKFLIDGEAISSRKIRELIKSGNTEKVSRLRGKI